MKRFAALVLTAALLAGCGKSTAKAPNPAPAPPASEAPAPQLPAGPPLVDGPATPPAPEFPAFPDMRLMTLDELRAALEQYMNAEGTAAPRERLAALLEHWGLRAGDNGEVAVTPMAEADLNGDGAPELITALTTRYRGITGAVFVIDCQGGRCRVDMSDSPREPYMDGVALMGTADLTGDGKPEIVWVAGDHGAHTSSTRVLVSRWQPGKVENLPGDMITTMARVKIDGENIVLIGGTVGSAGAGMTQRAAEFRYRWNGSEFFLTDRRFEPSEYAYHRLVDGINAETFQRSNEALDFYRSALEPGRPALPAEHVPSEWQERFGQAVTEFARFRLGLRLGTNGDIAGAQTVLSAAAGPFAGLSKALAQFGGCPAAVTWGEANPVFFAALGSPYGYNNYRWTPADLCSVALPDNGM